jgi:phosphoglycolate phosphatase
VTAPTLVFDLDGTLVDTAPDLAAAANHVLSVAGLTPVDVARLRPYVGKGARRTLEAAFGMHGRVLSPDDTAKQVAVFIDHYSANISAGSRPFPGVLPVLETWRLRGARLAVCTNKRETLAVQLLDALGLSRLFIAIVGGDTFPVHKPDPQHLVGTIARAGGQREAAIMIGDTDTDIDTARAARVPVIAVAFGYADAPVQTYRPDAVIGHFDELSTAIHRLRSTSPTP